MRMTVTGLLCLLAVCPLLLSAKNDTDTLRLSAKLSDKYTSSISSRSERIQSQLDAQTAKYLQSLSDQEQLIRQRLNKVNPAAAEEAFSDSKEKYSRLAQDFKSNTASITQSYGRYIPSIDSALTSLKFLRANSMANPGIGSAKTTQIGIALDQVKGLEQSLNKVENVKAFISEREQFLTQTLTKFQLVSEMKAFKEKAYYYRQQIRDLKNDWAEPTRLEARAVALLNKIPVFSKFMKENSLIAGLFNVPDNHETASIAGLQTRGLVQKNMQEQMTLIGPKGTQTAQGNIANAQSTLALLRNRMHKNGSVDDLPDFNANPQKTKNFFQRLELGANVQSDRSSYLIPASSEVAATLGYKLNAKNTIGIGISYKTGWGQPIKHIHLSNEGFGLRSFLDYQLKGSLYATGGAEYLYQTGIVPETETATKLWQSSALIGISKIISLQGQAAKKMRMQLLVDLLSQSHTPHTQLIKFRVGYNF